MKMHPKPAKRHTNAVEQFNVCCRFAEGLKEQFTIHFKRKSDGATSLLTMTEDEAKELFEGLAVMLKYKDLPASEIETEEWLDLFKNLRAAIREA